MGRFKEISYEVEQGLQDELGRDPTHEELEKATEDYIQSYNEHLDDLAEDHYQSTAVRCGDCVKGVKHIHEKKIDTGFEYRGFVYSAETEHEDDNVKIFHEVKTPKGQTVNFNMSPYINPTETDFKRWVDLGCPTERFDSKQLKEMSIKNIGEFQAELRKV